MQIKKIAAGIGAALAMAHMGAAHAATPPPPSAVADAYLAVNNFTILAGNGALGKSNTPLNIFDPVLNPTGTIRLNAVNTFADAAVSLNGVDSPNSETTVGLGVPFNISQELGSGAFVPNTLLTGDPTSTYAGAATSSVGNALNPLTPDTVPVHTQVSLNAFNTTGSAQSNQNLLTTFQFSITAGQLFELNFDADGFLRAALGQDHVAANASYSWTAFVDRVVGQTSQRVLTWNPDGEPGTGFGGASLSPCRNTNLSGMGRDCFEYADAFAMNNGVAQNGVTGENLLDEASGTFEMELFLASGTYTFTIQHKTLADATIGAVPEPGTLALLGLGMLGMGAARRRKA